MDGFLKYIRIYVNYIVGDFLGNEFRFSVWMNRNMLLKIFFKLNFYVFFF